MSFQADGMTFDEDDLLAQFRDLIPLISKFSIGDDIARGEAIEAASDLELRELVERVDPRSEELQAFVKSDPDSAVAGLLLWLTEGLVEASMQLGLREETAQFPDDSEDR